MDGVAFGRHAGVEALAVCRLLLRLRGLLLLGLAAVLATPLALLRTVLCGVPPLWALQGATLNSAKAMGLSDSLGTVAAGKVADLVLLERDPLEDIWAISRIAGVFANGRYFDRAALDYLLIESSRE